MAKDLAELRGNRWLPRVLTKKSDEVPTIPIGPPSSSLPPSFPASNAAPASPSRPHVEIPSGISAGMNGGHKERELQDMSMEDAELYSAMENLVQKLNVRLPHSSPLLPLLTFWFSINSWIGQVGRLRRECNAEVCEVDPSRSQQNFGMRFDRESWFGQYGAASTVSESW